MEVTPPCLRWLLAVALLSVEIGMESGQGFGFLVSLKREEVDSCCEEERLETNIHEFVVISGE